MSSNNSINGNREYYQRKDCWIKGRQDVNGVAVSPPLMDSFRGKSQATMERVVAMINNMDGKWITRETRFENPDYYMWIKQDEINRARV
jgi:hypothetical protein